MFLHIFMYISTYFYIFLAIFTARVVKSLESVQLPLKYATKVCCFTTDCHKSVLFYYRLPQKCVAFTTVYRYLPHKCGILLQFDTKVWHIQAPKCARKTGTNKLCAQSARFLALIWHTI